MEQYVKKTLFVLTLTLALASMPALADDINCRPNENATCTIIEIHNQTPHPISFQANGDTFSNGHVQPGKAVRIGGMAQAWVGKTAKHSTELDLSYAYSRGAKCSFTVYNTKGVTGTMITDATETLASNDIPWWTIQLDKEFNEMDGMGVVLFKVFISGR